MIGPADEIKAHLDIVDVIKDYVQLKPAGRIFKGLCPFHNEKTPSFTVTPDRQMWHCFGCNKGGDVISFITEKEGLSFIEAIRFLAPRAGVVLKKYESRDNSLKTRALDALDEAADYYAKTFQKMSNNSSARQYVANRGLSEEIIEEWSVGFSPNSWDDLMIYLKNNGFSEREIESAGLSVKSQRGSGFYNRFRNRIMFPIRDAAGQTVGFTARVLPGSPEAETMGKYVNSPQSIVFDKSKILFGLDKAKNHIREIGFAVVVEGQMDALTAHQFGFKNTVASSGTALTEEQMSQLSRFCQTVVLALDADEAGQKAVERVGDLGHSADDRFIEARDRWGRLRQFIDPAKGYKLNIKVAVIPSGKDPDEAIRQSPEAWRLAINNAVSLAEFYFERSINGLDLSTPEAKTIAANRFLPFVNKLSSELDKDYWFKKMAAVLHVDNKVIYSLANSFKKGTFIEPKAINQPKPQNQVKRMDRTEILSENLLAAVLKYSSYLPYIADYVLPESIALGNPQILYKELIVYYNETKRSQGQRLEIFALDYNKFKRWLLSKDCLEEVKYLDKLVVLAEKDYFAYDNAKIDAEIKTIANDLAKIYLNKRRMELGRLIVDYEAKGRNDENIKSVHELMKELAFLNDELKRLS